MRQASGRKFANVVPADVGLALDDLGIDYVIRGDEAVGLCPNPDHDDRSPSWSVNLSSGLSHCFSCGWGGSFVKLVATVQGSRFGNAEVWIRTYRVQSGVSDDEVIERAKERREKEVRESDLWNCGTPPPDQLARRCITEDAARASEVLWHNEKDCWIFPVRDPGTGALLGWQEKSERRFVNRPTGLDKKRSLFGMEHLKTLDSPGYAVLVESPLDVARFKAAGVPFAASTYGSEFSQAQIDGLWNWVGWDGVIVFALDNDTAGQRKTSRYIGEHPEERDCLRVFDYGTIWESRPDKDFWVPEGDGRDPGNLSDEDLRWGVANATPAARTYFEAV